jgi:uncharacterized membrane protein YozB (DUF420 family)
VADLLGTGAPIAADLVLLFELAVGAMLIVGMFVVRRGHVRLHMYIQSSMVLVNIPVVLLWMAPTYLSGVLPDLRREFAGPYYLLPTIMLVAGLTAEALGVYIILVAATNLVPERFRFRRYKRWMRTELVLWWTVLLTGVSTYYVWYLTQSS